MWLYLYLEIFAGINTKCTFNFSILVFPQHTCWASSITSQVFHSVEIVPDISANLRHVFLVNEYLINYINKFIIFISTHILTVQTLRLYSYLLKQVFFLNICSHDQAAHVKHRMMTSTVKMWLNQHNMTMTFLTLWPILKVSVQRLQHQHQRYDCYITFFFQTQTYWCYFTFFMLLYFFA